MALAMLHGARSTARGFRCFFQKQALSSFRPLSRILARDANNYDLLRLILASAVIYAHAYAIQPAHPCRDPLSPHLPRGDVGSLAVTVFFVLSGLFVVDSLLTKRSAAYYAIMRASRIFPGLFVCLALTALAIGPLFTTLSTADYVRSPLTLSYLYDNLALTTLQWRLPGVFSAHAYGLNGSLWTLPIELRLYVIVAVLYLAGTFERRGTATLAIALALYVFFGLRPEPAPDAARIIIAFAFGALLAIHKTSIPISPGLAGVFLLAAFLLRHSLGGGPAWYLACAYALLALFSLAPLRRLCPRGDYSYGVYLYGFPVEQVFAHLVPQAAPLTCAAVSMLACWAIAALSWTVVERPALKAGRALHDWLCDTSTRTRRSRPSLAILAAPACLAAPLALRTLPGWGHIAPAPSDLRIAAFGPDPITHGEPFNTQPNGASALWVRGSRPLSPGSHLTIAGTTLDSAVSGDVITAQIPDALFGKTADLDITVLEDKDGHPSPSAPAHWHIR